MFRTCPDKLNTADYCGHFNQPPSSIVYKGVPGISSRHVHSAILPVDTCIKIAFTSIIILYIGDLCRNWINALISVLKRINEYSEAICI